LISLWLTIPDADRDRVIAELWEHGTTGITEETGTLRAFFETRDDSLLESFARYQPEFVEEEDRDWVAESQAAWQPFPVGDRFFLVPDWRDDPAPCGRIRLRIHPGMACGTGTHPCTQLCLQAMERYEFDGKRVIDVGTGSGILAEAARLLGGDPVFGCDIEHASTVIAAANLRESIFSIPVFTGSVRSIRSASIDTVVANLNAATLKQLAPDLIRIAAPGALLILSGFREEEAAAIESFFKMEIRETLEQDGWAAIVFSAPTAAS
jgi:Ribosomal protein L11 methylase